MKKISLIIVSVLISIFMFTACNGNGTQNTEFNVEFMIDSTVLSTTTVAQGQSISKPTTIPNKDGGIFTGWYNDSACTTLYNFSSTITCETKIYAGFVAYEQGIIKYIATKSDGVTVETTYPFNNTPGIRFHYNPLTESVYANGSVAQINNQYQMNVFSGDISAATVSQGAIPNIVNGNLEWITDSILQSGYYNAKLDINAKTHSDFRTVSFNYGYFSSDGLTSIAKTFATRVAAILNEMLPAIKTEYLTRYNNLLDTSQGSKFVLPLDDFTLSVPFLPDDIVFHPATGSFNISNGVSFSANSRPSTFWPAVYSVCKGVISNIEYTSDYDTIITIQHANGIVTIYKGLLVNPLVTIGDMVAAGDIIGFIDETLHLEIKVNGAYVDPLNYLPNMELK